MRDAGPADTDHDTDNTPSRGEAGRRGGKAARSGKVKSPGWLARLRAHRPGTVAIFGLAALAAVAVPVNALFFQDGRHPAPLFSALTLPAAEPARPAAAVAAKPAPAKPEGVTETVKTAARDAKDAIGALLGGKPEAPAADKGKDKAKSGEKHVAAKAADKPKPVEKHKAAEKPKNEHARSERPKPEHAKSEHAKSEHAKSEHAKPADKSDKAADKDKADKKVMAAQKALSKLGYKLNADGVYGGTTREAVEKFQRSIGAPPKGELTPKVMKQLAAHSTRPAAE